MEKGRLHEDRADEANFVAEFGDGLVLRSFMNTLTFAMTMYPTIDC
jgi:hypothetical protein